MKRFVISIMLIMLGCIFPRDVLSEELVSTEVELQKHVLYIGSNEASCRWSTEIWNGLNQYFQEHNVLVDMDRLELDPLQDLGLMRKKNWNVLNFDLQGNDYDLIVTEGNAATDYFIENATLLPVDVPIFYLGYNPLESGYDLTKLDYTGIVIPNTIKLNIQLGLKLLPETKKVAIITAWNTDDSEIIRARLQKQLEEEPEFKGVEFLLLSKPAYSTSEMLLQVSQLPPESSFCVFNKWSSTKKGSGGCEIQNAIFDEVYSVSVCPVFNTLDNVTLSRRLGGVITFGKEHGREAGAMVEKILTGGDLEGMQARVSSSKVIISYPEFIRYHLARELLPQGAVILDQPRPIWEKYFWKIVFCVGVLFMGMLLLVIVLLAYRQQDRKLKFIFRSLPIYVGVVDKEGNIHSLQSSGKVDLQSLCIARSLSQLPDGIRESLTDVHAQVFQTREAKNVDYECKGRRLRGVMKLLPKTFWGKEYLLWTLEDVSEEHQQRDQLQMKNQFLQAAANIADMVYFSCDAQGKCIDGDYEERYWARDEEGKSIPAKEWVAQEDIAEFNRVWKELLSGRVSSIEIRYRAGKKDALHYYEMRVQKNKNPNSKMGDYFGIIRDITKVKEEECKLADSNTLLNEILDHLPCCVFLKDMDRDGRYLVSNRYNNSVFNFKEGYAIGKTDRELFPPDIAELFLEGDRMMLEKEVPLNHTEQYKDYLGTQRIFIARKLLIHNKQGEKLLLGISFDVTELENKRRDLQDSVTLLRYITNNIPCMLWIKDWERNGCYVMANDYYYQTLRLKKGEIAGKTDLDFYSKGLADKYRADDQQVMSSKTKLDCYEDLQTEKTGLINLHTIKVPLLDYKPGKKFLLGFSFNVTELVSGRNQLQKRMDMEELFNKSLRSMLLNIKNVEPVRHLLKSISEQLGAIEYSVYKYDDAQKRILPQPQYLSNSGLKVHIVETLPMNETDKWLHLLKEKDMLFIPDLSEELEKGTLGLNDWKRHFVKKGVHAVVFVGVMVHGKLWGHFSFLFADKNPLFNEDRQHLVTVAVQMVEVMMERDLSSVQLERSEYEKQLIMDTVNLPILLFDTNLKLVRVNKAALRVRNIAEWKIFHRPCYDSFCNFGKRPDDCPVNLSKMGSHEHLKNLTVNGRDYVAHSYPIVIDGQMQYILKTLLDVTEANRARAQIARALADAQDANKAKSYFLATMSHEIRTPLNAVIGFSEMLQKEGLTVRERNEYLNSINVSGKTLLDLINDILEISKLEAKQLPIVPSTTDVIVLAKEMKAMYYYKAIEQGIRFLVSYPDDLPLFVLDGLRLRQILLNLTGNAMKFTKSGKVSIVIEFKPKDDQVGDLTVKVEDTGVGISEDFRKRIFTPYSQQDSIRDTFVHKGTGLGLAISHQLANRMGGTLEVESELNKGSIFILHLKHVPWTKRGGAQLEEGKSQLSKPGLMVVPEKSLETTQTEPSQQQFPPLKILVVDDIQMNIMVLVSMLKSMKLPFKSSSSARGALKLMKGFVPDIILTDIWMPDMDGSAFAKEIRQHREFKNTKIIAVTADTEARGMYDMTNFDAVLLKPVTLLKVENTIKLFLENKLGNTGGGGYWNCLAITEELIR